jgi:putative transcriptional regulator
MQHETCKYGSAVLSSGKLLVATPTIVDPHFERTVVLLCRHDGEGAFGLILNRPSDIPVAAHLPDWADLVATPAVVGFGGPVDPDAAVGLGSGPVPSDLWTPVADRLGLVDLSMRPADFPGLETVRIFAGYSGWGPDQLDNEIEDAGWFVVDSTQGDVFSDAPGELWSSVLRRQRDEIALFADFPADPGMN